MELGIRDRVVLVEPAEGLELLMVPELERATGLVKTLPAQRYLESA